MTALLALATLAPWSYSGFLGEAGAAPSRASGRSPAAAIPSAPTEPSPDPGFPPNPGVARYTEPAAPRVGPPPLAARTEPRLDPPALPPKRGTPAPASGVYRLADGSGQLWEHADPATLRAFVEARNRGFFVRPAAHPAPSGLPTCASGRCR